MDRERELDEKLPIIPHEWLGADCCGYLMIRLHGDQAEILCNECGASIRTVAVGDVESAMAKLSQTDEICTAICTHCGAVNSLSRLLGNRTAYAPSAAKGSQSPGESNNRLIVQVGCFEVS